MLQVGRYGVGIGDDLKLMRLDYSSYRVEEHSRVIRRPEVQFDCMYAVHVLCFVSGVVGGEVPLGHVLLWGWAGTLSLTSKGVHSQSEQAWMLIRLLNLDSPQVYVQADVSASLNMHVLASVLTASKCVLLGRSSMIRYL